MELEKIRAVGSWEIEKDLLLVLVFHVFNGEKTLCSWLLGNREILVT